MNHIITWVSVDPGVSTYAMELVAALQERIGLTIIESNETCVALNHVLFPDALVLKGNWDTFATIFDLNQCRIQRYYLQ